MIREMIATGKNIEDAKETARMLLGATEDDNVTYEVLDAGSRGILGIINVRPAKVKAQIEVNDQPAEPRRKTNASGDNVADKKSGDRREKRRSGEKKVREEIPEMPDTPAEPREAMIPESELKLEKLTVEEGEDLSLDFVRKLLVNVGLSATAELYACDDGTRRIVIAGEDASALIGHHGDTLDALQYLSNLASAKKNKNGEKNRTRVTIDIEGYRAKREETLRALARRMAQKALRNQKNVMLEPMSAYERRIIHSEVQEIEGVSTNSVGSDMNRRVVIYVVKKQAATSAPATESEPETVREDGNE